MFRYVLSYGHRASLQMPRVLILGLVSLALLIVVVRTASCTPVGFVSFRDRDAEHQEVVEVLLL